MTEIKPNIPAGLLKGKSKDVRWLYEQVDIGRQQNELLHQQNDTILLRLAENSDRQEAHNKSDEAIQDALSAQVRALNQRMDGYDAFVKRATDPKWITGAIVFGVLIFLGPIIATVIATHYFEKWIK